MADTAPVASNTDVPSPADNKNLTSKAGEPAKGKATPATTKIKAEGGTLTVTSEPVDPQGTDAARAAGAEEAAKAAKASLEFGKENAAFMKEIADELDKGSKGSVKLDERTAHKEILTGETSLGQARATQAEQAPGVLMSTTLDSWSNYGQQVPGNVSAIRNAAAEGEPIGGRR